MTNDRTKIMFRCDSSTKVGMGHVGRCIAIAQALAGFGRASVFTCANSLGNGSSNIEENGFEVHEINPQSLCNDALRTLALARKLGVETLVIDMCNTQTISKKDEFLEFLLFLADSELKVVLIEGMGEECMSLTRALPVSAIVVPYFGAQNQNYLFSTGCQYFIGEEYFPLRKEFQLFSGNKKRSPNSPLNLVVSMGGGDVFFENNKILEALGQILDDSYKLTVIGSFEQGRTYPFCFKNYENTREMGKILSAADCAIIGSGLTRYETAFLGTPSIVFSKNDEHEKMVCSFAHTGAVKSGGVLSKVSSAKMAKIISKVIYDEGLRKSMSAAGPAIIDGYGAKRLAAAIDQLD